MQIKAKNIFTLFIEAIVYTELSFASGVHAFKIRGHTHVPRVVAQGNDAEVAPERRVDGEATDFCPSIISWDKRSVDHELIHQAPSR